MKIALIGYGKMGHLIEQIAVARGHEVVCIIDIDNREDFDSEAFARAEVAIEFTNPTAAYGNICKAWERGVKVVTGSTGWMQEHGSEVERMCREEGKTLFWASNFSLGVYLFDKLNVTLARLMNPYPQYDPTARGAARPRLPPTCWPSTAYAEARCPAYTPYATTASTMKSALPTTPTTAAVSLSEPCSPPNIHWATRDCSLWTT